MDTLTEDNRKTVHKAMVQIASLFQRMESNTSVCALSVTLVYEICKTEDVAILYPVNSLRNLAIAQVRHTHIHTHTHTDTRVCLYLSSTLAWLCPCKRISYILLVHTCLLQARMPLVICLDVDMLLSRSLYTALQDDKSKEFIIKVGLYKTHTYMDRANKCPR